MRYSISGEGTERRFVVEDISGPVRTALSSLGFTMTENTAERRVDCHSRHVDTAFDNLAAHLEEMVSQVDGRLAVSWQVSLARLLSKVDNTGIEWALIGTTALAARGVAIAPGDIDLVTDSRGATALADVYRDELVFPVVDWPGAGLFGRAFDGCRVEWLGNDGSSSTGWTLAAASETVRWSGRPVRVPPVDVQLGIEERRGRRHHVAAIRAYLDS